MLNHFSESGPPVSEQDIFRFERDNNLDLPNDYRTFLVQHNGGRPFAANFLLEEGGVVQPWKLHFFFGLNDPVISCSINWNHELTKNTRPPGTLPIADDEAGNMIYLRWAMPGAGAVYFGRTPWDGEGVRLVKVSSSFTEFLKGLH